MITLYPNLSSNIFGMDERGALFSIHTQCSSRHTQHWKQIHNEHGMSVGSRLVLPCGVSGDIKTSMRVSLVFMVGKMLSLRDNIGLIPLTLLRNNLGLSSIIQLSGNYIF